MPFVVCLSAGGPYDDIAFVAGVRFQQVRGELMMKPKVHLVTAETALVPQLDLLAMEQGYDIESVEWEDDSYWSIVTLTRTS